MAANHPIRLPSTSVVPLIVTAVFARGHIMLVIVDMEQTSGSGSYTTVQVQACIYARQPRPRLRKAPHVRLRKVPMDCAREISSNVALPLRNAGCLQICGLGVVSIEHNGSHNLLLVRSLHHASHRAVAGGWRSNFRLRRKHFHPCSLLLEHCCRQLCHRLAGTFMIWLVSAL